MIILGVDGGGTKTYALALDENGTVLGSAIGGSSGYHTIGLEAATREIEKASKSALNGQKADIAVFCLGDCDSATDHARLIEAISGLGIAAQVHIYNDAFAALRAGSSRPYGVAVICGTGFNACGIAPDGRTAKLYALGTLTGDWGGGGALGEAAFRAVYRADDGRGEPTILTSMLLKAMNKVNLSELADWITDTQFNYSFLATLAPLVFEAADQGDQVARGIIIMQADEIAISAISMLKRLDMTDTEVDIVLSGGVVHGKGALLMERTKAQICSKFPKASVHRLNIPPVVGAAFLAFDQLGLPAPDASQYQELAPTV